MHIRSVIAFLILVALGSKSACAQTDSSVLALSEVPSKYLATIDSKVSTYTNRISKKTIKTLEKLSKWETKIKNTLEKVHPEAAQKLFGNNRMSFAMLLQKIKSGEAIALNYRRQYDKYRDDLTTNIKYLEKQKDYLNDNVAKKIKDTRSKLQELNSFEDSTDAIQQFIKERKKELINTAIKYMGTSKYLTKINKETWYYVETIKNYKEIFSDEAKLEQTIKGILKTVPGFQSFVKKNSMLASLFGSPDAALATQAIAGLQTRASVQALIQDRIRGGGPNAQQIVSQNLQAAQAQLNEYKDKLLKPAMGNGGGSLPDFKPNMQKTKTFLQRLEFGSTMQFAKTNSLMPTTMDVAITAGYKLNDKSVAGIGVGYKLGMGTLDKIRFTTEGINLRSFIDWKLKKQLYFSGGWEMNYYSKLPPANPMIQAVNSGNWQQSALAGISKKFKIKTKWAKETKIQLLYDFLAKEYVPIKSSFQFRIGYTF